MKTRNGARACGLWAVAFLATGMWASVAHAQAVSCGNANNREAKIQGQQVYDNVPDYVELTPGNFQHNVLAISASPSSRPTLGTGVTYTWSQTQGTPGSFSPTAGMATQFTLPNVTKPANAPPNWTGEVVKVTLTIHSTAPGCPGTWTTSITLNVLDIVIPAANLPPNAVAAASPPVADEGLQVFLSGLGSNDPENLPLTYSWQQLSGTAVTLASATSQVASFVAPNTAFPSGDTLVFRLTVSDGVYSDTEDVTVNVSWINDPPAAVIACPSAVDEGDAFSLDGSDSTDTDDGISVYEWSGGWPTLNLSTATGDSVNLTAPSLGYQEAGNFTFRLTTFDATGAFTFDECEVLVRDVTAPVLTLPSDIVEEAGGAAGNAIGYSASAFDAVDGSLVAGPNFSCAPASGSTFPLGVAPAPSATTVVGCDARDSAGNTAHGSFNVTVRDTTAPAFAVPADFTVEATGASGAAVSFSVPTDDAVDGAGQASCTPASGETLAIGAHPVVCGATDARQNSAATQGFTITVADTVAPVIDVPDSITLEAEAAAGTLASFSATWTDAVDGSGDATCAPASDTIFPITSTEVSCSHTDSHGNTGQASFTVTVADTTAPAIQVPSPIMLEALGPDGRAVSFTVSTTDAVDGPGTPSCDWQSGDTFPLGTTQVKCDATDTHGNAAAQASFTVTIVDTTPPTIVVPEDFNAEATGPDGAVVTFVATTDDVVDGAGLATCVPASGDTFPLGPTQVACDATDAHGNAAATSHFTVTVVDTTAPEVTVPDPITLEATGPGGAVATFAASWTDAVDGAGSATCSPASASTFALGSTTVTCGKTDAHGNLGQASFTVTVEDTTAPEVTVPESFTREATGPGGASATFAATWTDAVDGSGNAACAPASGSTFPLGATTVTCSKTDAHGNAGQASFSITVQDTTAPTINVPASFSREATGPAGAVVSFTAQSIDAVDGTRTASCAPASGGTFALGPTLVTCNATDDHGNVATAQSFTVTVVDTTAPVITVPASFSREATGPSGAAATYTATSLDAVDGTRTASCAPASGSTFGLGATLVTCNATDDHGNVATARSFTITVVDTTKPVISGLVNVTATAGGNSQAIVTYTQPTATDLVDVTVPVNCTPQSGSSFTMGITTVQCSATDAAGNTATGSFLVTVSYTFNGFFQPIDNGLVNTAKAGSAIPIKFSLGGNQGMNIFAAGSPASAVMGCSATSPSDEVELTVTAGGSSLQYDAGADQYIYVWKTDKAWLGCRQLRVTLRDGSVRTAVFKFR